MATATATATSVYFADRGGSVYSPGPPELSNRFFLIHIGEFCAVGTGGSRSGKADDGLETSTAPSCTIIHRCRVQLVYFLRKAWNAQEAGQRKLIIGYFLLRDPRGCTSRRYSVAPNSWTLLSYARRFCNSTRYFLTHRRLRSRFLYFYPQRRKDEVA